MTKSILTRSLVTRVAVAVLAAAATTVFAGCASDQPSTGASSTTAVSSSSSAPATSAPATASATAQPAAADPEPGTYTVAVALVGGSGKMSVESPATLVVTADAMTATVTWSSKSITWVKVGDTQYTPTSASGEPCVVDLPVVLDTDMAVTAETVAMGDPKQVDYTLRFDSSTLKAA